MQFGQETGTNPNTPAECTQRDCRSFLSAVAHFPSKLTYPFLAVCRVSQEAKLSDPTAPRDLCLPQKTQGSRSEAPNLLQCGFLCAMLHFF